MALTVCVSGSPQRYSVDFSSRPDEANIPLSTVDPVDPADAGSQNGQSKSIDNNIAENMCD